MKDDKKETNPIDKEREDKLQESLNKWTSEEMNRERQNDDINRDAVNAFRDRFRE